MEEAQRESLEQLERPNSLSEGDAIAQLVIDQYNRLPSKFKPLLRSNGCREWTILAGVVLTLPGRKPECVSLATGMKTTPDSIVAQAQGRVLHDMHAEILALRAFARFILEECKLHSSAWIDKLDGNKFRLKSQVKLNLYISTAPCGDSSMGLFTGESWASKSDVNLSKDQLFRGREHFNVVGVVRTKPGRADSNMSLSKSCGDKLSLMQTNGCLPGIVSQLLSNSVYINALICPDYIESDFKRCFGRWRPRTRLSWQRTKVEFEFSQKSIERQYAKSAPSKSCVLWTANHAELLMNGVLQNAKALSGRGASVVSRYELAVLTAQLQLRPSLHQRDYLQAKQRPKFRPDGWQQTAVDTFLIE